MIKWLGRLAPGGGASASRTDDALRDYPAYRAPHIGPPTAWTRVQAEENLAHLVLHRGERLAALGTWLRDHAAIDIRPALVGGDLRPLLQQLHAWSLQQFPKWHRPALAPAEVWLRSTRDGDERVFSLLLDLSLLLGELVMTRNPGYTWGLDLDPDNERDRMHSWQRPVLKLPAGPGVPEGLGLDLENLVVARFRRPDNPLTRLSDDWADEVTEAASGAKEAAWAALQ